MLAFFDAHNQQHRADGQDFPNVPQAGTVIAKSCSLLMALEIATSMWNPHWVQENMETSLLANAGH